MSNDVRFRQVARYAAAHGYAAGFPNFHEADHGRGVVYGTILLRGTVVEGRDVPRDTYGVYHIREVPALFRAANDYAVAQGFAAGFANCEQAAPNGTVVYGTMLLRPGTVEVRDVPRDELGVYHIEDVPGMMRAANDWAVTRGFVAGLPTFHQADHGQGVVCGVILFPAGSAVGRDTSADFLHRYTQPRPWKILLCHLSDGTALFRGVERATRYFTRAGAGTENVYDYWRDITYRTIDIGDSTVHGPLQLAVDSTELARFTSHEQRAKVSQWGVDAARAAGIAIDDANDLVCVILAEPCDSGKAPHKRIVLSAPFTPTDLFPSMGFVTHEMGHAFVLPHSFGENAQGCATNSRPGEYCDKYDIMSFGNVFDFDVDPASPIFIKRGPGANGVNLRRLGAMDFTRVWEAPGAGSDNLVTLAALNRPDVDAPLMATFQAQSRAGTELVTYALEYREPTRWDRGFREPVVLVRELRSRTMTVLLTNYNGGVLSATDPFVTPDARWSVRLVAMDPATSTATVRIRSLLPAGADGVHVEEIIPRPGSANFLDERVIITNGADAPVDITGWTITDAAPSVPHVYTFPALVLPAGAAVLVWTKRGTDSFPNFFWNRMAAVWNNTGDTATLRDASGRVISTLTVS